MPQREPLTGGLHDELGEHDATAHLLRSAIVPQPPLLARDGGEATLFLVDRRAPGVEFVRNVATRDAGSARRSFSAGRVNSMRYMHAC